MPVHRHTASAPESPELHSESVFYTLNGKTKTISTTDSKFIMNNISGRYKITKVSDKYCETIPTDNIEAEIQPALKPLQIVVD